jgi:HK97 family phage prohead protease
VSNRIEIKANISVSDEGEITGIAWPFNSPDRVGDIIERKAFANARTPLPLLFAHDPSQPLGVWNEIQTTGAGLTLKGRLLVDSVERAREVRALVQAGAVTGLSIGFRTKSATPRRNGGRVISALELLECSLVTIPSHPGARVTSAKSATATLKIVEAIQRAASAHKLRK